jgi:exodeoxyribonuclease V alpha subunit
MQEKLKGFIERVTYHNPENGFAVLRVNVEGKADLVSVVGSTTSVTAGEHVEASGRWVVDRQHGQQFKADKLVTTHPASAEGIEKYLGSGAIRSVGPKIAARIVSIYKEQSLQVLEDSPDFLLHVKGIGQGRLQRIRQSWQEQKEVRKIVLFLTEHGITPGRAVRIFRTYGHQAIAKIKENPYQLADDIRGIGFKTADELAARVGIDRNSPYRAKAAVRYTLQDLAGQGHCGYPEPGVVEHAVKLVEIDEAIVTAAIETVVQAGTVIRDRVDGDPWLYLLSLYRAETGLASSVRRIASAGPHPLPSIDADKAIAWVAQRLEIDLADAQCEAIRQACQNKVLVITGGPGVGKTTLVRSILEIFAAKGCNCVLAAPTGRAAKRLAETTGREAKTAHRLLEFDPVKGNFKHDSSDRLSGDLFVFDETSMVDVMLGDQILQAIPSDSCVILVGDVDQLPSVGPGSVLADLIESNVVPVVRLTEVFRQASESRIIVAANSINIGRHPDITQTEELTDFYFVELNEPESIVKMIVRLVKDRIPERFDVDAKTDIQVLTPMNRSLLGARSLNQELQQALNPGTGDAEVQRFGWTFRVGDRVIQNENNYNREVFNGDLGLVEQINRIEQTVTVVFEGRPIEYDFGDLDELSLAYVLSIHKSQGSEFPCVVVPVHTQHYLMLQRNLLYTAVTRAKRLVVLVGSKKALGLAIRQIDTRQRHTALRQRLQSAFARHAHS